MKIKESSISQLLNYIDIVDVISDYVQLKKRGKNFQGLCPFHTEKTPSFSVSQEKGMYHCFGCGEGGNAISFLMKIEKFSFVETVQKLAAKFNFTLQYEDAPFQKESDSELDKLYEYSQSVARFYYENLTKTNEGEKAYKYLTSRGLTDSIITSFGLGYSLGNWGHLLAYITRNNFEPEYFEKLGLLIKREDGSYFERFRERIMFPIFSTGGRVIAFGGRILTNDPEQPKYLNSPETRIFNKSRTLFGLSLSKDFIRTQDSAVIVEGYMDLISLYQKGLKNVVASCGTALTSEQLQIISRMTKNVYVMYDSDAAGKKAAFRACELLLEADLNFKIVSLPPGEDPDSLIQKLGLGALQSELENAKSYIDFLHQYLYTENPERNENSKLQTVQKIIELTAKVKDPIKRALLVKDISEKFKIVESAINQSLEKQIKTNQKFEKKESVQTQEKTPESKLQRKISSAEKGIIRLLLDENQDICDFIHFHLGLDDIKDSGIRSLIKIIYEKIDNDDLPKAKDIANKIEDEETRNLLVEILFEKYKISESWKNTSNFDVDPDVNWTLAEDYIKHIKISLLEEQLDSNRKLYKNSTDLETIRNFIELEKTIRSEIENIRNRNLRDI